jgi:uncharacterized protein (TIGR02996 family)
MARVRKPSVKQRAIAAPAPAKTLLGPHATKTPAKPARKRAQPPPVPRAGRSAKPVAVDPAVARGALDAVLAAPADDAPRAAYAELLTAAGNPRGELISVGLELARLGDRSEREDARTKPLWDRFRYLQSRYAIHWVAPLRALGKPTRWRWRRGFVEELRIDGRDAGCTPSNLTAVLAAEPVTELAIEACDPDLLARLLAVPGIERIRRLAVTGWAAAESGPVLGPDVGRAIAAAKRLSSLAELRAGIQLGDGGVLALLEADALAGVTHLALGAPATSTETFAALAASPLGQRLEVLEWLREPIGAAMAQVLVTMPSLHTFVASAGHVDACRDVLAARFRDRLVVETGAGLQFLIDGLQGVTHRPAPKR